jgi:hypothetical protein
LKIYLELLACVVSKYLKFLGLCDHVNLLMSTVHFDCLLASHYWRDVSQVLYILSLESNSLNILFFIQVIESSPNVYELEGHSNIKYFILKVIWSYVNYVNTFPLISSPQIFHRFLLNYVLSKPDTPILDTRYVWPLTGF